MKGKFISKYFDILEQNSKVFLINKKTMQWIAMPKELLYLVEHTIDIDKKSDTSDTYSMEEKRTIEKLSCYMTECGILESKPTIKTRPKPLLVRLQITGKCNLACKYCYDESHVRHGSMDWSTFKNSVDLFFSHPHRQNGITFIIYGGEAVIEWELFKKGVQYINECSHETGVFAQICLITNGTLLDTQMISYIRNNNIAIGISFDGHGTYNRMRMDISGNGITKKIMSVIQGFEDYPLFYILTTVTSNNDNALLEIVDFLSGLSVPAVAIRPFITLDRAAGMRELSPDPGNYADSLKKISHRIEEGGFYNIRIEEILRLLLPLLTTDQLYADTDRYRCTAGRKTFFVSCKGELKGCDTLPNTHVKPIGNVNGNSYDFNSINKAVKLLTHKDKQCSKCTWMYICRGGCPGSACSENDTLESRYKFGCAVNKIMNPYLLDMVSNPESRLKEYFLHHMANEDKDSLCSSI